MTYIYKERGSPAAIIKRTYHCTDCSHEFSTVSYTHLTLPTNREV